MSRLLNKTLYVRTLSGIALLIVVLGTVLWSPYSMLALGVFLTAGIMREFYRIGRLTGARPLTTYPIVVGAAIVVLAFLIKTGTLAPVCLAAALPAVFVLFIAELYRKQPSPLTNIAWEIAGIVYAAVPMALFVTLPVAVRGAAIDYSCLSSGPTTWALTCSAWRSDGANCSSASPRTNRGKDSSAG